MLLGKHSSLKKTYFMSFFGLIVIPIVLIFFITLSVISHIVRSSAIDSLQSSQQSVLYSLTSNVRDASLQLSHFIYVNDGKFMEMVAEADTADITARYEAEVALSQAFQMAALPKQGIISTMFYMKDGKSIYLKDEIRIPADEIWKADWYQKALENQNTVITGGYDTASSNITYSSQRRGELILVTALSPDIAVDRSEKIEIASMFTTTSAGKLIRDMNQKSGCEATVILDAAGQPLFRNFESEAAETVMKEVPLEEGVFHKRVEAPQTGTVQYTYLVSREPTTGWYMATGIKTGKLTEGFRNIAIIIMLVILLIMGLFYRFSSYFLTNIIEPVHLMMGGLKRVEEGNLDTHLTPSGQKEVRDMLHSFNRMTRQLKASVEESERERQMKHEAEMRALQSQINPHFLVNSLNSIRFMAQVSKYEGIRRMAEAMIKILTCSFRSNSSYYTVKEEIEVLDSFLYLMKIRYSNGFDITYQIDDDCLECRIPRLILQPIVENSIVHGFGDTGDDIGHLEISAHREKDFLVFEIRDDGSGMTEEELRNIAHPKPREGNDNYNIGIENVFTRLQLNFGDRFDMKVESVKGEYTRTVLRLPIDGEGA